jgi:UDP-galactopyranose mutase
MSDDILCLSHLRWDYVFQRPHHLMTRFAREQRVFYFEEPELDAPDPYLSIRPDSRTPALRIVTPHLPPSTPESGFAEGETADQLELLLGDFMQEQAIEAPILWYYTPMALTFTRQIETSAVVYDCMDDLSAFANAPTNLLQLEGELFARADLVFTGGQSLYEAKRDRHPSVHCFPSSVDVAHFAQARRPLPSMLDQATIPHPRLGFYGVIDERMDLDLLDAVASARPDWHFVLLGPVTKIEEEVLPRRSNLHYLGPKRYEDLPEYLAGWDIALLPFARNASTRYISPTKTPEYLAAGKPVISTSIHDVVHPYGEEDVVRIADTPADMVAAVEAALAEDGTERQARADELLGGMSWDRTWAAMDGLLADVRRAAYQEAASV